MANGFTETVGIEIKLTGAETSTRAINTLTASLINLRKACDNVTTGAESFKNLTVNVNKANSALSSLGKIVSLATIAKYLSNCVAESMRFTETLNYANISMGEFTDNAISYANEVNSVYSIDQNNWLSYQSVFMNLASGFGVARERAYLMSQQLTQLSYDIQSVVGESMGLNVKETAQKLQSGIAGEIEPVRRLGYDLSKTKLEAVATELGITKLFSEMTQAEKVQLRYYALMTQLTEVHGDFGRTLNSPANQLKVLQENLTQLARAIGNIFIPLLNIVLPLLTAISQVLRDIANFIANLFGFSLPEVDYSNVNYSGITDMSEELDDATGKAKALKKQLAGFDEINNLTTPNSSGSGDASSGGGWIDFDLPTYDFLASAVESNVAKLKDTLSAILPIVVGIGVAIGTLLVLPKIIDYVKNFDVVIGLLKESVSGGVGVFGKLWATIMANPIVAVIAVIAGLVSALVVAYKTNDEFKAKVDKAWYAIKTSFTTNVELIKKSAGNLKQGLADVWTGIKTIFKNGVNAVIGSVEWLINKVIGGLNTMFGKLNKISWKIPSWVPAIGGNTFGFNINTLSTISMPRLAQGGIVSKSTIANIGEAGKEAVVPLERNTDWMNTLATKVANESSNSTDVILEAILDRLMGMDTTITLDGQSLTNKVVNRINQQTRLQGKGVLI